MSPDPLPDDAFPGPDPDAWDANDPRRQKDQFAPPAEPCECYCLHCQRTFMSDGIWFQKVVGDPQGFDGFWMCPTPNCSGAGFTFDIFPTDPNHPANEGWTCDDDFDEVEFEEEFDLDELDEPEAEYDADETRWKQLESMDDDIEGEEWKHGLAPGERPEAPVKSEAQREWEEEQKLYDLPDERPRVVDWSDREDRGGLSGLDDVPF